MRYIWVLEIRNWVSQKWEPTIESRITRKECRKAMHEWKAKSRWDEFRITKYVPQSEK